MRIFPPATMERPHWHGHLELNFIRNAAQRPGSTELAFSYLPRLTDPAGAKTVSAAIERLELERDARGALKAEN